MTTDPIALLAGIVSIIAVIVTLITASTSAKSTALTSLQGVVDTLQRQIEKQEKDIKSLRGELAKERNLRMAYEDYIQALILRMREASIEPPSIADYLKDREEFNPIHTVE